MKEKNSYKKKAEDFFIETVKNKYSYNFKYLSRPIIQYPQDVMAFQELVWNIKPDIIIETGIAHGGSVVLSASLLAMLDYEDAFKSKSKIDPQNPKRKVIGVDVDIRDHNLKALEMHPLRKSMVLFEGSSTDEQNVLAPIKKMVDGKEKVMVCLDSNHTHSHVLKELELYSPLVTKGSYCIVYDTVIEDIPNKLSASRPWGKGNNPKTAVSEFLNTNKEFEIDYDIQEKLMITVAPNGYLKKV